MLVTAEYMWLDGTEPSKQMRSKTRVLDIEEGQLVEAHHFPDWSFDGSSTYQAEGSNSDLILRPVYVVDDPIRTRRSFLVLCEVFNADGTPHSTNTRALLRNVLEQGGEKEELFVGFEQEYTLFQRGRPLGWPEQGYPAPQGPFYCGIGSDKIFGREMVEMHTEMCMRAGILFFGTNAEVMPGQWEFQIGPRGNVDEEIKVENICDDLWIGRALLHRIGEEWDIQVCFDNKPITGDWNGAGCHANFSTKSMRSPATGLESMSVAVQRLAEKHKEHIALYGAGLEDRLTGAHETCRFDQFRAGVADRGASIRLPRHVKEKGYGYLEDRRPGANCDPYLVAARLLVTICDLDEKVLGAYQPQANSRGKVGTAIEIEEGLLAKA